MTMLEATLQERSEPKDPLVREWREKNDERLRLLDRVHVLNQELRDLKTRMAVGVCQVCGQEFRRVRPTKMHCSQACLVVAYRDKQGATKRSFDIVAIREHLPMLAMLMTPHSMRVLENLSGAKDNNLRRTADSMLVSHQRVSQIANKATKLILAFKLAQHVQAGGGAS